MATDAKQVLKLALELTDRERADLAVELLASLSGPDTRDPDEWIAEIERRARTAAEGTPGLSWQDIRARVEERLSGR